LSLVCLSRGFSTTRGTTRAFSSVLVSDSSLSRGLPSSRSWKKLQQEQQSTATFAPSSSSSSSRLQLAYVPPEQAPSTDTKSKKGLFPRIGDIVRYYDLDGGQSEGQEIVGKITFLSTIGGSTGTRSWLAELTELENVGDGFFAEYSSRQRMSKKSDRDLRQVSPMVASYVRGEQAFKVPLTAEGRPSVRQEQYDLDEWDGPAALPINEDVVAQDGVTYDQLKANLIKSSAIAGLAGTVLVNILKGPEDAIIYFFGALASVGYLFFLSVKTDTLGAPDGKLGKSVANLRFLMPVIVIVGVALYNQSRGDMNPLQGDAGGMFDTVTAEQFGAAVLGFLTYRVPLFLGQIQEGLKGEGADAILPGSAGVAMQLAKGNSSAEKEEDAASRNSAVAPDLIPVLLVSGPQATGRSELVQRLIQEDDRLVAPTLVDKNQDGVTFERLTNRDEFLEVDPTGRFGLTKASILQAAANAAKDGDDDDGTTSKVVVVDANVSLARTLQFLSGARLIGVWVGLNSVPEFEERLKQEIESGKVTIPADETEESIIRARIKEIVNEIEFGLSSGIFEFTILNESPEQSLKELKEASSYCFK
jgi:guanylate kinase